MYIIDFRPILTNVAILSAESERLVAAAHPRSTCTEDRAIKNLISEAHLPSPAQLSLSPFRHLLPHPTSVVLYLPVLPFVPTFHPDHVPFPSHSPPFFVFYLAFCSFTALYTFLISSMCLSSISPSLPASRLPFLFLSFNFTVAFPPPPTSPSPHPPPARHPAHVQVCFHW